MSSRLFGKLTLIVIQIQIQGQPAMEIRNR